MLSPFEQHRPTTAVIDLAHLVSNFNQLKKINGNENFFCPMIKANAYGHGDYEIAKALELAGAEVMGVGLIEEGVWLRSQGIKSGLLFFGLFDRRGAEACLEANLTPVLSSWEQVEHLQNVLSEDQNIDVHLKFDTGMHRLGFEASEIQKLREFFVNEKKIKLKGILTHLHSGEDADQVEGESFEQLKIFESIKKNFLLQGLNYHTLNSAGLLNFAKLRADRSTDFKGVSNQQGARPGLALYGLSPIQDDESLLKLGINLKPVMSLRSKIIKTKSVVTNAGVSYNHTWHAKRNTIIGVVPVGYADGYNRLLSNCGEVLIDGVRLPVVGNVCMDYFMVDLTEVARLSSADALVGKSVTLFGHDEFGNHLSVNEIAKKTKTISWEVLTRIGERVPRKTSDRISAEEILA